LKRSIIIEGHSNREQTVDPIVLLSVAAATTARAASVAVYTVG
jgi:hypothetical protein